MGGNRRPFSFYATGEGMFPLRDTVRSRTFPVVNYGLIAVNASSGRWTHGYPITVEEARELGMPVTTEMPEEAYKLMSLYPQRSQRRPSVEYIPMPYTPRSPAPPPAGLER